MPLSSIQPQSDEALNCYHQKLSWKIRECNDETLYLQLERKIPRSLSNHPVLGNQFPGGRVTINSKRIKFSTVWPKDVDHNKISLDAVFTIKIDNGSSVTIKCHKIKRSEYENSNVVDISKAVKLTELLYDVDRCFTIQAELKVTQIETNGAAGGEEDSKKFNEFVKDMQTIFNDSKHSDIVVIAGIEKFYCHKIILSARCDVFKNMLDNPNFIESESNNIDVKEVSAEAVGSMLRYIYTGEVPEDSEKLTVDLFNVSEMYLLDHLKDACLESLMKWLNVSSCISTLITVDRYMSSGGNFKEMVIEFIKCKVEEVVETEDWDKLVDNHPALAKELMRAIAKGSKEKHKCQFCEVSYKN